MGLDPQSVRRSYDRVASRYTDELAFELEYKPMDRALLSVLADDVRQRGEMGPIADLGSGPGHVAASLAGQGAKAVAVDLSPAMANIARKHLGVAAAAGDLASLPVRSGGLGGALALYCLIHLDDAGIDAAIGELARVVAAGGPVLIAFHTGTDVVHRDEWWGEPVDVDFRFLEADPMVDRLEAAGFAVEVILERTPYPEEADTRRTYILARRLPPPSSPGLY